MFELATGAVILRFKQVVKVSMGILRASRGKTTSLCCYWSRFLICSGEEHIAALETRSTQLLCWTLLLLCVGRGAP